MEENATNKYGIIKGQGVLMTQEEWLFRDREAKEPAYNEDKIIKSIIEKGVYTIPSESFINSDKDAIRKKCLEESINFAYEKEAGLHQLYHLELSRCLTDIVLSKIIIRP